MKFKRYCSVVIITCLSVLFFSEYSIAQSAKEDKINAKKVAIKNMVDSQHFIFIAQSVTPLRGSFRNLTSLYDVRISKDTLLSELPYFGRAYSAPINPSESGLNFTSVNFSYSVTPGKKNAWNVIVKPKDHTEVQQFTFTIYDNGSASLNVTSVSRDAISFLGYIDRQERKRKK